MTEYKIRNKYILIFLILGITINIINYGLKGIIYSLIGFFVPMILLFIFFALKMLGAGDIKLFGVIGSIGGVYFGVRIIIYSFIFAALLAIIKMIISKNLICRLNHLYVYLKNVFLLRTLLSYKKDNKLNSKAQIPMALPILIGTVFNIYFLIL